MKATLARFTLCSFLFFTGASFGLTMPPSHYSKGLIEPKGWQEKAEYLTVFQSDPIPAHFDWREKLGKEVPVKDQKSCGSCWAFSRVTTLQWQVLIQTGTSVSLSPQELVSCDREQAGCGGGFWDDWELKGISTEAEFPYTASDVNCKSNLPRKLKIDSWLYIGGKGRTPTKDEMKQAIFKYGPIGVTIAAVGGFPNGCSGGQTNHMVVVTGWDDATGTWIMQNSWGLGWGNKGYAPIKYGCFNIGETAAVSILNLEPEKPVNFTLENASVSLSVTVQPGSGYGAAGAKSAIQKTLNAVGN